MPSTLQIQIAIEIAIEIGTRIRTGAGNSTAIRAATNCFDFDPDFDFDGCS